MTCINHPKIPENTIESRAYQTSIAESEMKKNTLVVLLTDMGKTAVAPLVAANRIDKGNILMVAPTKPLVEQHLQYFSKNLKIKPEEICMVTGSTPSAKRKKMLGETIFCIAIPEDAVIKALGVE